MAAEENCTSSDDIEIEYILVLILLLYFLIFTDVKCSVRISKVQCSVSCHASKHHNFYDHRHCHKCHKVVCFGNVKDHIGHDLFVVNNTLNTLVFLLEISSTITLMEVQFSNGYTAFTETVLTYISKNMYEILKIYTPYAEIHKFFKAIKKYFKKYTLYHLTKLTNMKKLSSNLKPLSYTRILKKLSRFQRKFKTKNNSGKLKGFEKSCFINLSNKLSFLLIIKESTTYLRRHNNHYIIWSLAEEYLFALQTFSTIHNNHFKMLASALVSTTARIKTSRCSICSVKVACLNDATRNWIFKSIAHGDHLFSEIIGFLKESMRHNFIPFTVIGFIRCTDIPHNTTTSLLLSDTILEYSKTVTSIFIAKRPSFYICYLYNCFLQNPTEIRPVQSKKCSQLTLVNYTKKERNLLNVECNIFRQFGIISVTEQSRHQLLSSQRDHCESDGLIKVDKHNKGIHKCIKMFSTAAIVAAKAKDQALDKHSAGYCMPPSLHTEKDIVKENQESQETKNELKTQISLQLCVIAKGSTLPIGNSIDQITAISGISPTLHKLMIGNVITKPSGNAYYNSLGAHDHMVKGFPKEIELLPTVGPQLDAMYNANLEYDVQNSCKEIGQKSSIFYQLKVKHIYYLAEIEKVNFTSILQDNNKLQVKVYRVNTEENIELPKRSCISYGNKQNLSEELDSSFNKGSVNINFCSLKTDISIVEPLVFFNSLTSSIKDIKKSSAYPTLQRHYLQPHSRTKMLTSYFEYLAAIFNNDFKELSMLEETVYVENLLKHIWLTYHLNQTELLKVITDECKNSGDEDLPLQIIGNYQLLYNSIWKALKLQRNNNAIFRAVINKTKLVKNNYEIQRCNSSMLVKCSPPEMLSECHQSFLKEVKSALHSLPPKWCNAPNAGNDYMFTALEITCFNGIAYNYLVKSTTNKEQLFVEMLGGLKESIGHKMPYMVVDLRRCKDLTMKATAYLSFNAGGLRPENILNTERYQLSLYMNVFYFSYLSRHLSPSFATESRPMQWKKYSQLIVTNTCSKTIKISHIVTGLNVIYHQLVDNACACDIFRPFGKGITPATEPLNQQSFTNAMTNQQSFASQEDHCVTDGVSKVNDYTEGNQQSLQQYNAGATSEARNQPPKIQPESYHMPASNTNQLTEDSLQRDGHSSNHGEGTVKAYVPSEQDVVEKDGKLSMASGIDQATPISSIPSEHKLMIGNVNTKPVDHNPSGAHIVKELPKQTELLPTLGPQLDALYNTNFEHEVQSSHEEVRQKAKARTTFYQHEFEHHAYNPNKMGEMNFPKNPPLNDKLQVKVPEVKAETGKAANDYKPKPLPKRSQIVCGSKQYPLVSNLISHPHMDHYFVKERTEIRPSHYLAKLVLRHQYLNRYCRYVSYNNYVTVSVITLHVGMPILAYFQTLKSHT